MNALAMATKTRHPNGELVIHSDRGAQFTSWAFSEKVREAGLAASMGFSWLRTCFTKKERRPTQPIPLLG